MFINEESLKLEYKVESNDSGLSVIDVMATSMQLSSRLIRTCKRHKQILLNGKRVSVNASVRTDDIISVYLDHDDNTFDPNPIEVMTVYEDADILVVNKPPNLVVHPTKGHPEGTLANAVSYLQYKNGQNYKIRFINRLDRDTSGVLLIAKNAFAQQIISEQMQADEVDKIYFAIVRGVLLEKKGCIDAPIDRLSEDDILRGVVESGLPSRTQYEVIMENDKISLLKLKLETGRTHQIRVHLQYIGHPIIGDSLYGSLDEYIDRQALHCYAMSFKSPRKTDKQYVMANVPEDMQNCLKAYGFQDLKFD